MSRRNGWATGGYKWEESSRQRQSVSLCSIRRSWCHDGAAGSSLVHYSLRIRHLTSALLKRRLFRPFLECMCLFERVRWGGSGWSGLQAPAAQSYSGTACAFHHPYFGCLSRLHYLLTLSIPKTPRPTSYLARLPSSAALKLSPKPTAALSPYLPASPSSAPWSNLSHSSVSHSSPISAQAPTSAGSSPFDLFLSPWLSLLCNDFSTSTLLSQYSFINPTIKFTKAACAVSAGLVQQACSG